MPARNWLASLSARRSSFTAARARQREPAVFRADEDPAAGRVARAFEQPHDFLPVLELVEQLADPLEVFGRGFVDQVRLAADDQHRAAGMILAPRGESRGDEL